MWGLVLGFRFGVYCVGCRCCSVLRQDNVSDVAQREGVVALRDVGVGFGV